MYCKEYNNFMQTVKDIVFVLLRKAIYFEINHSLSIPVYSIYIRIILYSIN